MATKVLLIRNSVREAAFDLPFPSWPYDPKELTLPPNVEFGSDPCVVEVAGITVGVAATDVLKHLLGAELGTSGAMGEESRMSRVVKHLLLSQSFYPLYPAAEGVNLELESLRDHGALTQRPHVLFLPSDMRQFINVVSGVVTVNPGRLVRGKGGGNYARVSVALRRLPSPPARLSVQKHVLAQLVRI